MTTAQVVETSVTDNNNSPIEDYIHPDDPTQPTFEVKILLYDQKLTEDISITEFFYISDQILLILRNRYKSRP